MSNQESQPVVDQALSTKNDLPAAIEPTFSGVCSLFRRRFSKNLSNVDTVSYTHLTLPTIYSV